MELLNVENYSETRFNTAIALGNFDGVHVGHQQLIAQMIEKAKSQGLKSSVLLFENHTRSFLDGVGPALITSSEQKNNLISKLGVEIIYSMRFDESVMKLTPEEFVCDILIKKLNVKSIVVGTDYKFGNKASGNANLLKEFGTKHGIDVEIFDPINIDGKIVSSSRIRESILNGNMDEARTMLGRNYSIYGKVVTGKKIGKKLGYPTANIEPIIKYVLPKNGVYSTETLVNNKIYLSASSVGYNPTFKEDTIKIESHIIDFTGDIYNNNIELFFVEYLREEIKFDTMDLLKKQIFEDINRVKSV